MRLRMRSGAVERQPLGRARRRAPAIVATVAVTATGALSGLGVMPASAAPGSPGTPSAPTTLYAEDFENGTGTTPVLLTDYTGATGATYTADPAWLTACNGQISNFDTPVTELGNCATTGYTSQLRQLSWALGAHAGSADPAANHAVAAYTENNPGVGATQFQTVQQIPLATASGRFLTFRVDTAAVNCSVSAPLYQFSLLDDAGDATQVGGVMNACSSGQTVTAPAVGTLGDQAVRVGTYTSNGSVLFTGSSLGLRMSNQNGSGIGNDAAFDNIQIIDVTPQLDKAFTPTSVKTGGTATLTFTITNTSELAAKDGWSFTDALPAGLTVATPSAAATTCPGGVVTAVDGGDTVGVTGNLAAGMASCTVTVDVTADQPGTYTNGPDNVTGTGLNPPGPSSVRFSNPELSVVKQAGTPVDVNADGVVNAGDTIAYSFTVSNTGDVPLENVTVNDAKAGTVTCPQASLAPGASQTCTAEAPYTITDAEATAGSVDNSATATGTTPDGDTTTSTPSTTTTPTGVPAPDAAPALSVVKKANATKAKAGRTITYSFRVTNTGNVTITNPRITERTFTGSGRLSAITCPPSASTLTPGESATCTARYTVTKADVRAGSIKNTATVTGTPSGGLTPPVSPPSTTTVTTVPDVFRLAVNKRVLGSSRVLVGEQVRYRITVTNRGPDAAAAPIRLRDRLPKGLELVRAHGSQWTCTTNKATDVVNCRRPHAIRAGKTTRPVIVVARATRAAVGHRTVNVATANAAGTQATVRSNQAAIRVHRVPPLPHTGFRHHTGNGS